MQIQGYWHRDKLFAVTGTTDYGALLDPEVNVAVGYLVWQAAGDSFSPWVCAP